MSAQNIPSEYAFLEDCGIAVGMVLGEGTSYATVRAAWSLQHKGMVRKMVVPAAPFHWGMASTWNCVQLRSLGQNRIAIVENTRKVIENFFLIGGSEDHRSEEGH